MEVSLPILPQVAVGTVIQGPLGQLSQTPRWSGPLTADYGAWSSESGSATLRASRPVCRICSRDGGAEHPPATSADIVGGAAADTLKRGCVAQSVARSN